MRTAEIVRNTNETKISLKLNIDGTGVSNIDTGAPFLDHMLTLFSKHSRIDLDVKCNGDIEVDAHHTTEDVGICLGKALSYALDGDGIRGIRRYGNMILPMDEALILSAVDISGRAHLEFSANIPAEQIGNFDTELCREFFEAFVREAKLTLHIKQLAGENSHHIIEGAFKSVARSLYEALSKDEKFLNDIPSTKGVI